MKFITFEDADAEEFFTAIFGSSYSHIAARTAIARYLANFSRLKNYKPIAAGSIRFNGRVYFDYDKSMTLMLGSGFPETTKYLNNGLEGEKTLQILFPDLHRRPIVFDRVVCTQKELDAAVNHQQAGTATFRYLVKEEPEVEITALTIPFHPQFDWDAHGQQGWVQELCNVVACKDFF